jgi:hypothetical protein
VIIIFLAVQLCHYEAGDMEFGISTPDLLFKVQSDESVKQIIGKHRYQPERFNSSDGMFVNMVCGQ